MPFEQSAVGKSVTERVKRRDALKKQLGVVVTILGDGKDGDGYEKRVKVRERLVGLPRVREVSLPEEVLEEYRSIGANEEIAERAAIEDADLVICLEPPGHHPLGVYSELRMYWDEDEHMKWFRVYPVSRPDPGDASALIGKSAQPYIEAMESVPYQEKHWEGCERIRNVCEARVKRAISLEWLRLTEGDANLGPLDWRQHD